MERLIEAKKRVVLSIIVALTLGAAGCAQEQPTVNLFRAVDNKDYYLVLTRLVPDKKSEHADSQKPQSGDVMYAKAEPESQAMLLPLHYDAFQSILEGWLYLIGTSPTGYTDIIDATADGTSMGIHYKKHKQMVFFLKATNAGDKVHVDLRTRPGLNKGPKTHEDLDPLTYVEVTYDQNTDTWTVGTKKPIKVGSGPKDIDGPAKGPLKKIYADVKLKHLESTWPISDVDPN